MRETHLPAILSVLAGVMAGLGLFTFVYAQGHSYFSNDPDACANCHIMREHLDSWLKSSHQVRATCNDCHTPDAPIPKFWTKAENGWNHSVKFTLQNFQEPIRIRAVNLEKVKANCINCHGEFVGDILHAGVPVEEANCLHCHAGVGHGPRR